MNLLLHYFRLSLRLLLRNPFVSVVNVFGLSVAFGVFLVLWQYAESELEGDRFHKDHERIFRLYFDFYHNTGTGWSHYVCAALPPVVSSMIGQHIPAVDKTTRILHQNNFEEIRWSKLQSDTAAWLEMNPAVTFSVMSTSGERRSFVEKNTAYADPNLFEFFTIPLLKGHPESVLSTADAIVLSASAAQKYFGNTDPLGQAMYENDTTSFTVTGVFEDLPSNTHLSFDILRSTLRISHAIENIDPFQRSCFNYIMLKPGSTLSEVESRINRWQKERWRFEEWPGATLDVRFQPLQDASFQVLDNDVHVPEARYMLLILKGLAIAVFVIGWINYLNLGIVAQARRLKEFGARKAAGAHVYDVVAQLTCESAVVGALSVLLALTWIQLLKAPLAVTFKMQLPEWYAVNGSAGLILVAMITFGTLVAGVYPALLLSKTNVHRMLNQVMHLPGRNRIVQGSTFVQFVSAIALIILSYTVFKQVDYITKDSWGLQRDNVLVIDLPEDHAADLSDRITSLKHRLLATPGIRDVTLSTVVPGDMLENAVALRLGQEREFLNVPRSDGGVDERFIKFYGLSLVAGRNFLPEHPADRASVLVSRRVVRTFGLEPEDAVGKTIFVEKYPWRPLAQPATIIGVIEDRRYTPLYPQSSTANANAGTILTYGNYLFSKNRPLKMPVRIDRSKMDELAKVLEDEFRKSFPHSLFHWYFLEDHMNLHYSREETTRNQIALFMVVAIAIACLGLLGMISGKVLEKTKEIGIRRVLGARTQDVSMVLVKPTLRQMALAVGAGVPLSYYLVNEYLSRFTQHVTLMWWDYVFPISLLLIVMVITVLWHLIRSAAMKPVDCLRYE